MKLFGFDYDWTILKVGLYSETFFVSSIRLLLSFDYLFVLRRDFLLVNVIEVNQ